MKVALVYDRVNKWGGAEKVLLSLHEIFPDAPLYTSVYDPKGAPWAKVFPRIIPSFLQKFPFIHSHHEYFPFLMPLAFESFNFDEFELVISVTSETAKGIRTKGKTRHICYCLTPTRYLWSHYNFYFKNKSLKNLTKPLVAYLRKWDKEAAKRPHEMIAISNTVRQRIKKYYGRDSKIIFPPVDVNQFNREAGYSTQNSKFFLIVSRLVPYKRIDLAIEAFNRLGFTLVIIGRGSEEKRLKKIAKSNVKFLGQLTDKALRGYYEKCVALIFPQEEDFGMVAVEAQAAGRPVIAFREGGATESILENKTGLFFNKQSPESLMEAIKKFEGMKFNSGYCFKNAAKFSKEKFKKEFLKLI